MTAALSQSGQRTPCGQRCWRTRSKHLASSSSAERLTNSDTAMMTASSSNQDEILGPSNRMSPATATPTGNHHPETRQEPFSNMVNYRTHSVGTADCLVKCRPWICSPAAALTRLRPGRHLLLYAGLGIQRM